MTAPKPADPVPADPTAVSRGAWPEGTPGTTGTVPVLSRVAHDRAHERRTQADPAGGRPVRVLAHVLPDTVELLVVDRGPGVPPERRERMFEPFQRLDETSPGGLGLGLAVARGLADAVGGSLSAEDTPGGGLTMVLSLPRARG